MTLPPAIEMPGPRKACPGAKGQPGQAALRGVDLLVPRGSCCGLPGPKGAGGSTPTGILAGLAPNTAGTARVRGGDLDAGPTGFRRRVGVVPQELSLDPFSTPREAMEMQAALSGIARRARRGMEILDAVALAAEAEAGARSLSGGMRRRPASSCERSCGGWSRA